MYYVKLSSIVLAVIAISVAPLVAFAPDGLYFLLQELNGIFFIPISSVIIAGLFFKQINTLGAKTDLFFGFTFYILTTFIFEVDIHFVHLWGIEFVLNFILMFTVSKLYPSKDTQPEPEETEEKSWSYVKTSGLILTFLTILIYILLS